jgi:3-carboxy-cis,cis-muconate cycloisomerase
MLVEALERHPEITRHSTRAAIERLTDPTNDLGLAPHMLDRVLRRPRGADQSRT